MRWIRTVYFAIMVILSKETTVGLENKYFVALLLRKRDGYSLVNLSVLVSFL